MDLSRALSSTYVIYRDFHAFFHGNCGPECKKKDQYSKKIRKTFIIDKITDTCKIAILVDKLQHW